MRLLKLSRLLMCCKVKVLIFINPDMNGIGVSPIFGSILVHVLPGWDGGIFKYFCSSSLRAIQNYL